VPQRHPGDPILIGIRFEPWKRPTRSQVRVAELVQSGFDLGLQPHLGGRDLARDQRDESALSYIAVLRSAERTDPHHLGKATRHRRRGDPIAVSGVVMAATRATPRPVLNIVSLAIPILYAKDVVR
jgi:hypothetical protein